MSLDVTTSHGAESSNSASSFGAIIAGALASTSVALVLAFVAAGMGLAIATPGGGVEHMAAKFAASTAIGFIVIEWLSSAIGGYVAGRLRARWVAIHDDEIFFRDTVHGFLAWAVATLVAVGLMTSAFTSILSGGAHALATASGAAGGVISATAGSASAPTSEGAYWADELLRASPQTSPSGGSPADARPEVARILLRGLTGEITQADKDYLAQLVAARAGVDAAEAKKRVDAAVAQVDEAKRSAAALADSARKVAATTSLMTALAFAIGAFISSAAAALGGRQRDE